VLKLSVNITDAKEVSFFLSGTEQQHRPKKSAASISCMKRSF
jgi:hypothetical protein